MSARMDRSLLLAWGVGLALCGVGAFVTRAAIGARAAEPAPAVVATSTAMRDLPVREAWDRTVTPDSAGATAPDFRIRETAGGSVTVDAPAASAASAARTSAAGRGAPLKSNIALARRSNVTDAARSTSIARVQSRVQSREQSRVQSLLQASRARARRDADSALAVALRDTLRRVLDAAVADSAFPGAYAVVGNSRGVLADYGAGRIDWAADAPAATASTMWDLASLTKVVGMTSAVERLVDAGVVRLDARVQRYLPDFKGPGKEKVTVRQLLTHSSGLPSWRPLHKEAETPEARRALVLATPLDTTPGVRYVYSDLGAITLGLMVERLTKQPLDRYLATKVFRPLGMRDTRYRPDSSLLSRIAPTEIDPWRQRHLRGEVHDENAFALGGVSGHAGLFSTGHDLARLARMYLGHGSLEGRRFVSRGTIARFVAVQDSTISRRALGWETPTGNNSAGHLMGAHAFGHTGFTGTSMWMDPDRDLFVILLTNRVNPTRQNTRISRVRVALADAVMQTVAAQDGSSATPLPSRTRP